MIVDNEEKFFKPSWISACILKNPQLGKGGLQKGAIILNQVDPVLELYPKIKDLFFIVERHGWFGPNEATRADIMMVEDLSCWDTLRLRCPHSILLDVGPSDFVDTNSFFPMKKLKPKYDVIQVSCWSSRKRIDWFIEAAEKMPDLKFVHLGHFENNGSENEIAYKNSCLSYAAAYSPNIYFPYADLNSNDGLPESKDAMNQWINEAKVGVLTTMSEGINRFKMECLSANRPCLVPNDVGTPTRKHVQTETGQLYNASVDGLVDEIRSAIAGLENFSPREYVLGITGLDNTLPKLKKALNRLAHWRSQEVYFDDIYWDGRNESLMWGEDAVQAIESALEKWRSTKVENILSV